MKNTLKNDFARHFHRKYIKIWKMRPGDSQSEPKGRKSKPKGRQSEPKVSQSEPKVRHREPKVSQRKPKRDQREPKGNPKGAKGRPKCIQKSTFGHGREKYGFWWIPGMLFGVILVTLSIKHRWTKSMRKSMPKMSWKLMKIRCGDCLEIDTEFYDFRKSLSWKIEFSEKGVPTQTTIFMQ